MPSGLTRRNLVARAAAGTVVAGPAKVDLPALSTPTEAEARVPNPDDRSRRLGVAVVGLGHLSLLQILPGFGEAKHVRLAALVSGDAAKAKTIAAQYGVAGSAVHDYAGFERLRDDADVDFIYIVLPNSMHREYVERAAAIGKHVLCEKPMATSSADARAMIDAMRAAGRKLMIAYRCQYEPTNREATRMARAGELGELRLIEAVNGQNNADDGQWRHVRALAGGGSLPDVGIYCLNAARYLTGEEPVEIFATLTRPANDRRFREVEDVCAFTLTFPSGVVANCSSAYSLHESRQLRVMGSTGWLNLDPAFAYENLELNFGRKVGRGNAVERRRFPPRNQFALEMDHFAEAIRADRIPRTPGEEGLQDMRLIEAIYQAADGGSRVRLPEVKGRDVTRGPALQDEE